MMCALRMAAPDVGACKGVRDMAKSIEITVRADADLDDCLTGAAKAYIEEHPDLAGYDLSPRWADDDREMVALTVPAWHLRGEP